MKRSFLSVLLALGLLASTAQADNYHYHEVITRDKTAQWTEWTGYPGGFTPPPAYAPADLSPARTTTNDPAQLPAGSTGDPFIEVKNNATKKDVVVGSVSVSTIQNDSFSAPGNPPSPVNDGTNTVTWTHTFNEDPLADRVRWVELEIDLWLDGLSLDLDDDGHYDEDEDKHVKLKTRKKEHDSATVEGQVQMAGTDGSGTTIIYTSADEESKQKKDKDTDRIVEYKYRPFEFDGTPLADYLAVEQTFLAGNQIAVTFSLAPYVSCGDLSDLDDVSFAILNSELTVDYIPAPVPEPSTMLLLASGLTALAGAARRRNKTGRPTA